MTAYRRHYVPGGTYFFTVALAERSRGLLVDHIDLLRASFRHIKTAHPFDIVAIVILPDHLHTVWALPEGDCDYSTRWRQIKSSFSRALPHGERISASRKAKAERGIWQRRFWEHTIRDEADLTRCVDYIHFNPVKHDYVSSVSDWPHSSFHHFVENGFYPHHWASSSVLAVDDRHEYDAPRQSVI